MKKSSNGVATKADLNLLEKKLTGQMVELKEEIRGEMVELKEEIRGEMVELKEEIRGEMAGFKNEIVEMKDEIVGELKGMREIYDVHNSSHEILHDEVNDHELRLRKLEKVSPLANAA